MILNTMDEIPTPEPANPSALQTTSTPQSALERKFISRILQADPGIGDKSVAIANSLADSGLPAVAAAMVIQAVYAPTTVEGYGQANRIKWFVDAVRNRYSHKLERIKTDYRSFRSFIADMEEVVQMRDELNGDGYSVSFELAFTLWELGEDSNSVVLAIEEHLGHLMNFRGSIMVKLKAAALAVASGKFTELATALQFLNQTHMAGNDEDYNENHHRSDSPENW